MCHRISTVAAPQCHNVRADQQIDNIVQRCFSLAFPEWRLRPHKRVIPIGLLTQLASSNQRFSYIPVYRFKLII